jgi:CheY-like chemotaxis protein/predicted negative regulator of RcsB-dependent stress response
LSKPNLLVADADPRSLRILEVALRKAGFAVATATDGGEAERRAIRTVPDLVLCDVALPAQDGLAVCRALRAEERLAGIPIVLMGADKTAVAKARAIESGADDYLAKPILLQDLVQRARLLIERRERQTAVQKDAPAALTGAVADLGLLDVFQSLENWKKSAVVFCQFNGHAARVWVRDGQVIDAELGPLSGEPAFWRLMTWETGQFRVEFGPVDRELRIDCGTQALLMEAMRRVDELGRSAEQLPPDLTLSVDFAALAARLAELPDEVNGVVRSFDGKRTLKEALEGSPLDDLNTLAVVQRLLGDGILRRGDVAPAKKPSLHEWLGANAPVSQPPPAEKLFAQSADSPRLAMEPEPTAAEPAQAPVAPQPTPLGLIRFPPLRGVRRERLRREAEETRGRITRGEVVRLSHVVELPGWRGDGADTLSGLMRRMSPAVGEAARKFAPDAPVSRIVLGPADSMWEQQTAPSFKLSSAPPAKVDEAAEADTLPPSKPPPIAPVAVNTPPTPPLRPAERDFPAELRAALGAARAHWPWYAAGGVLAAGALAWFARPQPATDKKDAPWLEAVAAPTPAEPRKTEVAATSVVAPPQENAYAKALREGDQLVKRGKYRPAIREFKRATQLNPEALPALLALGDAYLEADEPRSAMKPLEKAARLDARNGRAQLLLGTAYQSLGRNAEAVKAYQLYLQLDPGGDFAHDVRTILANLQR